MVQDISCPYCDAQSFVYNDSDTEMFLCHGCQRNQSYEKVKQYVSNTNDRKRSSGDITTITVSVNHNNLLHSCQSLASLEPDHIAVSFVRYRSIPDWTVRDLYYTESLGRLVNSYGYEFKDGQPKLIIPFRDEDGKLFGLQARSLDDAQPKYLTVLFDKDKDKIFGLDRWNKDETTIVVEGPIDSFFLKNSLAMAGSDIGKNKYLEANKDIVLCLDNEPRNAVIVSKYLKFIKEGYSIVLWPDYVVDKDINDMVLNGLNPQEIIATHSFSGPKAQIKLNSWKKV